MEQQEQEVRDWAPVLQPNEVPCARMLCGDGYAAHAVDGILGGCTVCLCPGFLWVDPDPAA